MALSVLPAIALGLLEKRIDTYGLIASILMLLLIFGNSREQAIFLLLFYLIELAVVKGYSLLRPKFRYRGLLWTSVVLAIAPLVFSKYVKIFAGHELGFLGISYLTFRAVQMLVEINDGLIKETGIRDFTYFILFFPTISSGPIDRSRRFIKDVKTRLTRSQYIELLGHGLWKIMLGVGYKFVMGDLIYHFWLDRIPKNITLLHAIDYMYAYSMYLFFDFAGYSSIAVGVSYIFSIKTPDNFNRPFFSRDIKDFWNRWHMSLSFWFRDFIFTRFVMTSLKKQWFRNKHTASYIGYMLTMGLMGLWHGARVFYIIYGLYHGVLLVATDLFQRKSAWYIKHKDKWQWKFASTAVTFNLVCFGFLIFSGYLFK